MPLEISSGKYLQVFVFCPASCLQNVTRKQRAVIKLLDKRKEKKKKNLQQEKRQKNLLIIKNLIWKRQNEREWREKKKDLLFLSSLRRRVKTAFLYILRN